MRARFFLLFVSLVVFSLLGPCRADGLVKKFYKKSCPKAEDIVKNITWSQVASNPALPAKLIRVLFHDCFVRGCDASILLDTVGTTPNEKQSIPNLSVSGFEVYDSIKAELEKVCPGIVSCADIVALAARDAISFQFRVPMWEVFTGRRDGKISLASNVIGNLPSPFSNFSTLQQIFANKGLNRDDLVALSGAHTIGVAHCGTFARRLYNFTGKGDADPSLDPTYAASLRSSCPNPINPATTVEMDPHSSTSFDSNFFVILNQNQGLFQSDAALLTDPSSVKLSKKLQKPGNFFSQFGDSVKKMGAIEVLTGNAGEIRKQCRSVNS